MVPPAFPEASAGPWRPGGSGLAAGSGRCGWAGGAASRAAGRATGEGPPEGRDEWRRYWGGTDGRAVLGVWGGRRERPRRRGARWLGVVGAAWREGAPFVGLLSAFKRLSRDLSWFGAARSLPGREFERLSDS